MPITQTVKFMTLESLKILIEEFALCKDREEIYQKIMNFGQKLPSFNPEWKKEENRVMGCQSLMYLHTEAREGRLFFYADSDALISKGLASLLIFAYSGRSAEEILKSQPTDFQKLGIIDILTPGRANGFSSLFFRIKQEALKLIKY